MESELWRWADPNGQQRRVRFDELRSSLAAGLIAPNTPVWKPGWKAWQPAHDVPELSGSANSAANGVVLNIPPPPLAMLAVQQDYEQKANTSFSPPPMPAAAEGGGDEPPPPPTYVPASVKQPSLQTGSLPVQQLPSSLPTTIGLPPPPELQAMAAKARATVAANNAAKPKPPDPMRGGSPDMIEELSGSMLLDERPANGALPAPTDPTVAPEVEVDDAEIEGLRKARNPLHTLIGDIEAIRKGEPPKNKPKLIAAGVLAGALVLLVLAIFISILRAIFGGSSDDDKAKTKPSGSASAGASSIALPATTSGTPAATTSGIPPPPQASAGPSLGDCATAGEAKALGWRAVVASGIDAVPAAGTIALGFAASPKDGVVLGVDPSSGAITQNARAKALGPEVKHVLPSSAGGKLVAIADSDRKGDKLAFRRSVATNPPIDVGVADGQLVWAPHGKDSFAKLFGLDGDAGVEALRGVPLANEKGIAVAFRKQGAVWVGVAKGDSVLTPEGSLAKIAGLGQVGLPAIAVSGDTIVVAWSDRAAGSDAWQVRWTSFKPGATPLEPRALAIPEGGPGGQAMSPSVAGLGGGRFLLAWSEGKDTRQVRALTMTEAGAPSGSVLNVSPQGLSSGQPQIAVGSDGKGVIAFLSSKGKGYDLQVTPISCAAR